MPYFDPNNPLSTTRKDLERKKAELKREIANQIPDGYVGTLGMSQARPAEDKPKYDVITAIKEGLYDIGQEAKKAGKELINGLLYAYMGMAVSGSTAVRIYNSKKNYEHNKKNEISGYIYNQAGEDAKKYKYGSQKDSTNGCGWVSVYNAMQSLGVQADAAEVIKFIDDNGGPLLGGVVGTNPIVVEEYFRRQGKDTKLTFLPDNLDESIRDSKTSILAYGYINPNGTLGAHYINVTESKGKYYAYNVSPGETTYNDYDSIESLVEYNKFWPLALITID